MSTSTSPQMLAPRQRVHTITTRSAIEIDRFLGGGGQGEVYQARMGQGQVALKWYYPASATPEQRKALAALVESGAPSDKFLWPIELCEEKGLPGFGYVMPLRDARFRGVVDLFFRRSEPDLRILALLCLNLADTFLQLHAKGLCYRDISHGNVFFDERTGEVLICDCDNVGVTGSSYTGVTGTSGYSAPEIERHEAMPSTYTDLHSLAVLMFKVLMLHHPLEGVRETAIKCFDLPAREKLYGWDPLFIFDPQDRSNKPDIRYHHAVIHHWEIYPQFLRDLFTRAFTVGLRDPQNGRVRESEWRAAMARLRDAVFYCSCGVENFYDGDSVKDGRVPACWSCKQEPRLPPRLRVGRHLVMLNHDTRLYPHHLRDDRLYDFSAPLAEVTRHPTDPGRWGIKNLSNDAWNLVLADGTQKPVEPGRSLPLVSGSKVKFGAVEGEIRV
ncbi:MAG TPA: serine/threonine protein kinase [Polyangia bacterium]|nr:serine/threonine protein kinase [Polyangia bacterium]